MTESRPAIHQFHQGLHRRDAVGELILGLRDRLVRRGHPSRIFVQEEVSSDLRREVHPLQSWTGEPEAVLVVHHSVGHCFVNRLVSRPGRLVLAYHNITPESFFVSPPFREMLRRGRRQLKLFRDRVVGAIAFSEFSARELRSIGFADVVVVPPVFGSHVFNWPPVEPTVPSSSENAPLVLFVGRVSPNKRQVDVIEVFERFAGRYARDARLVLAGPTFPQEPYVGTVKERIARSPFCEQIQLAGAVPDPTLMRLLREARLYLSMSEHEGFGIPLLEAFAAGVPVLAYDAAAVAETMGGGGVLFARKDWDGVAAMAAELAFDGPFRRRVIAAQWKRLERPDVTRAPECLFEALDRWSGGPERPPMKTTRRLRHIQIQGPFETSYGLAVSNRRLAEALHLHAGAELSLFAIEGGGPYYPADRDLRDKALAHVLWRRSFLRRRPDVVIRNTYPPRFERFPCSLQLARFYWEESGLPEGWAENFNRFFDGVLVASTWLRGVLQSCGVTVPIVVVPSVVTPPPDEGELPDEVRTCQKKTRFLSVGSGFPRKGIDVLLRAFFRTFTLPDDVALIVKTFPNIHNDIAEQLEKLRRDYPGGPEVIHIDRELGEPALAALVRGASVLVQPSRAEGFGLPAAEAMLLGVPVIATSVSGLADFCTDETCLVVPHRMVPSQSHLATAGSEWAEPDEEVLGSLLRGFVDGGLRAEASRRAVNGRALVEARFSSVAVAKATLKALEKIKEETGPGKVGFVTTWNEACGIATTSEQLVKELAGSGRDIRILANSDGFPFSADAPNVRRVWTRGRGDYEGVLLEAMDGDLEAVHFEFHSGVLGNLNDLEATIDGLLSRGRKVFVTFHVIADIFFEGRRLRIPQLAPVLRRCHGVIVHAEKDERLLRDLGVAVERVPLGSLVYPRREREEVARDLGLEGRRVFASFGFALPHKGLPECLEATAILRQEFPNVLFLALASRRPEVTSAETLAECKQEIRDLHLERSALILDTFLSEDEIGLLLAAAEVVVLAYGPTMETASGAVRLPLAAGRATIVTMERIFADVAEVTLPIPDNEPETVAAAVSRVFRDLTAREDLERRARAWAEGRSWRRSAERHLEIYRRARGINIRVPDGGR